MSNCKNCGSKLLGKFCSNCGQAAESVVQETKDTIVTDANQLSNEEKANILRKRMEEHENEFGNSKKTKAGAIIRLVVMGLLFALCAWIAISDAITKDIAIMRTLGSIFAGVIFADIGWVTIKLCARVGFPIARGLWENLISLSLVGFFTKIGFCLGILLLPVSIIGVVLKYASDYLRAHESALTTVLIIAVPLAVTALIIWHEIKIIKE